MTVRVLDGSASTGYNPPSQTGNSGKYLTTNGTATSWSNTAVTLIATQSTANTSSITFSGIPQTFTHLRFIGRMSGSTGLNYITFSGNTLTGSYHQYATGTTVTGGGGAYLPLCNTQTGWGQSFDVNIPDYTSAKIKGFSAYIGGAGGNVAYGIAGASTQSTTAITSLTITSSGGTFSDFVGSLYGWN